MPRYLGLDVGARRIGIATSDERGMLATPREVISRTGMDADVSAVLELAKNESAAAIIVGIPYDLSGRSGHRARAVQRLVDAIEAKSEVPVHSVDERFSTSAAQTLSLEAGRSQTGIDARAAAVILQTWLDLQAS